MTDIIVDSDVLAAENFRAEGFHRRASNILGGIVLQSVEAADGVRVPYMVLGDMDADNFAFTTMQDGTGIMDASEQFSLAQQQVFLGKEVCIVAVETYHPERTPFNKRDLKTINGGLMLPFVDRLLPVIVKLEKSRSDAPKITLVGIHRSGDEMIETTNSTLLDKHRGVTEVTRLGVFEPLRSRHPGAIKTNNKIAIIRDAGIPLLRGSRMNHIRAFINGYTTDTSKQQLRSILAHRWSPRTLLGRRVNSPVTPDSIKEDIFLSEQLTIDVHPDGPSIAGNPKKITEFILKTIS